MNLSELISKCNRRFARDLSGIVDVLSRYRPLSSKFSCASDEVYTVCVGDWLYYIDRRQPQLKRVTDWRELMFILRNYAPDIVKMVENREFVKAVSELLKRDNSPQVMHRRRTDGIAYIGGIAVEFDEIVVFSDMPCVAHLIKNGAVVGIVDVYKCSELDRACMSFVETYGSVISEAADEFAKVYS